MRRILRVYLKYHCQNYVEIEVGESVPLNDILTQWKMDGYIMKDGQGGAPFAVPWDSWSFCAILVFAASSGGSLPTGTTFDFGSGKPN
jgi:hypothetical protein